MVKYLVSQGALVHAMNDGALGSADQNGHWEVVEYLGGAYSYVLRLMQWLVK